jgi:hypothetical protein
MSARSIVFKLNNKVNEFYFNSNSLQHLQLFTSDYVLINPESNANLKVKSVSLNDIKLPLSGGLSDQYELIRLAPEQPRSKEIARVPDEISIGRSEHFPYKIIITVFITSLAAVLAILSIVVNICIRKPMKRGECEPNHNKFSSRNPLEISVSCSGHNSPSSSSSSFSGLTTTQTLSRNTFQSAANSYITRQVPLVVVSQQTAGLTLEPSQLNNLFEIDSSQLNHSIDQSMMHQNGHDCSQKQLNIDLFLLKNSLNWLPSYDQYKHVLEEFGQLANHDMFKSDSFHYQEVDIQNVNNSNPNCPNTVSNAYQMLPQTLLSNNGDKQTFV